MADVPANPTLNSAGPPSLAGTLPERMPLASVAVALMLGVLCQSLVSVPAIVLFITGGLSLGGTLLLRDARSRLCLLLFAVAIVGGLRWQLQQPVADSRAIDNFAGHKSRLVRLRGLVDEAPQIRRQEYSPHASAFPQYDTTVFTLATEALVDGTESTTVMGRVQIRVTGHCLHARIGDRVELTGWLAKPQPPANPGDFDFAAYLQKQHIGCLLYVGHPDAVVVVQSRVAWGWKRKIAEFRRSTEQFLATHLPPDQAAVTAALLIGERSRLPRDIRDNFVRSGMMHVLAISGLHAAIFVGFIALFCRGIGMPPRTTAVILMLAAWMLAVVTGLRPPVVRAAVFLTMTACSSLLERPRQTFNILAAAIIVLLMADPQQLFDTGAQLSCLAVVGILWAGRWPRGQAIETGPRETMDVPWQRRVSLLLIQYLQPVIHILMGIWLLTAPLIAATFYLVSPVGLLLNVVLMPIIAPLLALGYCLLLCGFLCPPLVPVVAAIYSVLLGLVISLIETAGQWRFGSLTLLPISTVWLAGYYLLIAGCIAGRSWRKRYLTLLILWFTAGLLFGLKAEPRRGLTCQFLSVGHGIAILIETPNGNTLLYDIGAIDKASRATQAVTGALQERRHIGVNGVVISHADLDHLNGLADLLGQRPVKTVFVSQPGLDFEQKSMEHLCEQAFLGRVPVRVIGRGDRLLVDPAVEIEVLNPTPGQPYEKDNANSLVLLISYAGRSILLTGDLEDAAVHDLIATGVQADVLLAPHHGSARVDHAWLGAAIQPQYVVVSTGGEDVAERLGSQYFCPVYSTHDSGAVTVTISSEGDLELKTMFPLANTNQ